MADKIVRNVRVWDLKGNCLDVSKLNNKISKLDPIVTKYKELKLGNTAEDLAHNLEVAAEIGLNNRVNVVVTGELYGVTYNVEGIYHDGTIHTINEEFDLNVNTGEITLLFDDDNTTAVPLIYGASMSDEDKAKNLEVLSKMSIYPIFFCRIDAGYGTASFNSGAGGYATITTAQGVIVRFIIASDGGVTKDQEIDLFTA